MEAPNPICVASLCDDPLMPDLCTPSDSDDEDSTPHRRRRILQPPPPPRSPPAATRDLHLGGGAGPTRAALMIPHDLPDLIPVDASWRVPAAPSIVRTVRCLFCTLYHFKITD